MTLVHSSVHYDQSSCDDERDERQMGEILSVRSIQVPATSVQCLYCPHDHQLNPDGADRFPLSGSDAKHDSEGRGEE